MKKALLMTVFSFAIVMPAMAEEVAAPAAAPVEVVEKMEVKVKKPQTKRAQMHSGPHWGYVGNGAAHRWGDLSTEFEACKKGVQQSPININEFVQGQLPALSGNYQPVPLEVANNGHTVQVNYAPGSGFRAQDKNFNLLQFNFRTPSEHYVDGAPYPMEAHFVHKAADGALGVVGVMFKVGEHNPVIEGIWQNVPQAGSAKTVDGVEINAGDLMPADKSYYKYDGSLTTPPCTEGVQWYVMKEPIELSAKQLTAFQAVFPVNARPIQALGERVVTGN